MDWQVYLQLASIVLMVMAVVYSAMQARAAGDAVRSLVDQALTDRMISHVRFFAENPEIAKRMFRTFSPDAGPNYPEKKIQEFLIAHVFLLQFESVLTHRKQLREQYPYYIASMRQLFSATPAMHEWMVITKDVWSKKLRSIAEQNQPIDEST